ncbi:ArnT family glycosyltransferase [Dactylosporangium sp. CS-047395]|uniref:ArnT family glycosyltransferase n=1 Tax=Dactylosporangium sp. CS-047395 TaxID=3239936 RepID=UPI003D8F6513
MTAGAHRSVAVRVLAPARGPALPPVRSWTGWPAVAGIVLAALILRLTGLSTAYDVFIDEPFYTLMGASVADGHLPPLNYGQPFLLHPPGLFVMEAMASLVLPDGSNLYGDVFLMRAVQQLFAVISAVLVYLLVRRAAGHTAGLAALLLFSVDPFVLRQNGRVLLETATTMFVLGGFVVLARIAADGALTPAARRRWWCAGAGLLFGAAILTKDMAAVLVALPLAAMWFAGKGLRRAEVVLTAGVAAGVYLAYVLLMVVIGDGAAFWRAKTGGFARMSGAHVTTGFTSAGAPSMLDAALARLQDVGPSYAVVAVGAVCGLVLLLRPRNPTERLIGLLAGAAGLMITYGVAFGTFEEHFLYFLIVPAIAGLATAAARIRPGTHRRVLVAALCLVVALDAVSWARTRLEPDDGQRRAAEWLMRHAPAGSKVAWVTEQTQYSLDGTGLQGVELGEPGAMAAQRVTYLIVLERVVAEHYSSVEPEDVDWFTTRATKVFSFTGRAYGEVAVYQTRDPAVW